MTELSKSHPLLNIMTDFKMTNKKETNSVEKSMITMQLDRWKNIKQQIWLLDERLFCKMSVFGSVKVICLVNW